MKKLRFLFSLVAVLLLPGGGSARASEIDVSYARVPLNYEAPSQRRVGMLEYMGGLSLWSEDARFGGLSALLVGADGGRMLAASDRGMWFSAELIYDRRGWLSGVASARLAPIGGANGKALAGRYRDAESLARAANGAVLLAFEQRHRILRFDVSGALDAHRLAGEIPKLLRAPGDLSGLAGNSGMEAVVTLADGTLLVIAEGRDDETPGRPGWLLREGLAPARLAYKRAVNFRPTGATRLPGGDVLALERRYTMIGGVAALLRRVAKEGIAPGAVLDGPELARLVAPLTVDNMEGIAARRDASGRTLIYLLSDDNFSGLQRTLLLMFALREEAG